MGALCVFERCCRWLKGFSVCGGTGRGGGGSSRWWTDFALRGVRGGGMSADAVGFCRV
jgi:hypothetical protein